MISIDPKLQSKLGSVTFLSPARHSLHLQTLKIFSVGMVKYWERFCLEMWWMSPP